MWYSLPRGSLAGHFLENTFSESSAQSHIVLRALCATHSTLYAGGYVRHTHCQSNLDFSKAKLETGVCEKNTHRSKTIKQNINLLPLPPFLAELDIRCSRDAQACPRCDRTQLCMKGEGVCKNSLNGSFCYDGCFFRRPR